MKSRNTSFSNVLLLVLLKDLKSIKNLFCSIECCNVVLCLLLESASKCRLLVLTGTVCADTGHGACVGKNPTLLDGALLQLPRWRC